ncbi:hypothetical protein AMTRI_Chr01g104850 [Amborella trichopoda]
MAQQQQIREGEEGHDDDERGREEMPLMALNHISRLCRSVEKSMEFYEKVLGFVLIKRSEVFKFSGAWLFNYGMGIHLVQSKNPQEEIDDTKPLDPMDNHISFQCEDMGVVEEKLKEMKIKYMRRTVEEGGCTIDQMFFKDPDGFMIEILTVRTSSSCLLIRSRKAP